MSYYNKQADLRDQQNAEWFKNQHDYYSEYNEKHLRNALNYAKGCGGSETLVRRKMIKRELNKRGLFS